jgi:hypothetical protein
MSINRETVFLERNLGTHFEKRGDGRELMERVGRVHIRAEVDNASSLK